MTEENFDIDDLYDETNTYTGKDQDTKTDEAKVNYEPLDSSLNLSNEAKVNYEPLDSSLNLSNFL